MFVMKTPIKADILTSVWLIVIVISMWNSLNWSRQKTSITTSTMLTARLLPCHWPCHAAYQHEWGYGEVASQPKTHQSDTFSPNAQQSGKFTARSNIFASHQNSRAHHRTLLYKCSQALAGVLCTSVGLTMPASQEAMPKCRFAAFSMRKTTGSPLFQC